MNDEVEEKWWEPIESVVTGPFVRRTDRLIDCTMTHPELGQMPFTAASDDVMDYGRAAYAYASTQLGD